MAFPESLSRPNGALDEDICQWIFSEEKGSQSITEHALQMLQNAFSVLPSEQRNIASDFKVIFLKNRRPIVL